MSLFRRSLPIAAVCAAALLAACGEGIVETTSVELTGSPESGESALTGAAAGLSIRSNANVNLRAGPSTNDRILLTVPEGSTATVLGASASNGFYRISFSGREGWSYGRYWDARPAAGAGLGEVRSNGNVNLRTGAGTGHSVILTVPEGSTATLLASADSNGWLRIRFDGHEGFSFGQYWDRIGGGGGGAAPGGQAGSAVDAGISRAASGVGFSYWWGGGRWTTDPGANHGACYGLDFNEHAGQWGADCSGFLAKVWQVPGQISIETQGHPYSTFNFYNEEREWSRVSRDNTRRGDAMVYRADGGGHIFLFERGDSWGQMWSYEARSCDGGIVHNLRTASASYRAIRRNGW